MEDVFPGCKPVKLHYSSCSTTETHDLSNPPIILLHGFFANSTTWNRIKCQISNKTRRKVYSVDLRNHGKSEYSNECTTKHMSADLLQFMEDEKIKCATLIGHSAGGRVCMELALKKPEMVENLVVEDVSLNDVSDEARLSLVALTKQMYRCVTSLPPSMSEAGAYKMLGLITAKYMPEFSVNKGMSQVDKALPFAKDERTGQFKFLCNMEVIMKSVENLSQLSNDLSGDPVYNGKTLFIKGEHTIIPIEEDRDLILKHFPQSEFVTMKGGYHVSHTECPEAFAKTVGDFLMKG